MMDSAEKKRKLLLGGALVVTLLAVALVDDEGEDSVINTVEPVQTSKSAPERSKAQEGNAEYLDVSKLGQRKFNSTAGELFVSTNWAPKKPKVTAEEQAAAKEAELARVAAIPPPTPTAPPLQFKYTGKAISGSDTWVFLSQPGENFIARIGGKINEQYRLDTITDNEIKVTYLPLNIKQTLTINNKLAGNMR